jgi:hypothetical protein
MATITLNDIEYNCKGFAYYDASQATDVLKHVIRGSVSNIYNIDLFPDTGMGVGDAVLFATDYNLTGKFNSLKLNIDVPIAGTGITGVWEYATGGSNNAPNWVALSGVVDTSNGLTVAGVQTITFTVPTDWDNFHWVGIHSNIYYCFGIRYRITGFTTWTEGGHLANVSNSTKTKAYSINCMASSVGDQITMQKIYDASVAGGWGVVAKNGNQYSFKCNIDFKSNYFTSKNEVIQFENNWFYFSSGGVWSIGALQTGGGTNNGSSFIFLGSNVNYPAGNYFMGSTGSYFYSSQVKHVILLRNIGFNGYWGGLGYTTISDLSIEGVRQIDCSNNTGVFRNIKGAVSEVGGSDCHIETFGGIIYNISLVLPSQFATINGGVALKGTRLHKCDLSVVTNAVISYYDGTSLSTGVENYLVDCNWGQISDDKRASWYKSGTVYGPNTIHKLWETSSFEAKVTNSSGVAIPLVNVLMQDAYLRSALVAVTSPDGYIAEDYGIATSGTTSILTDTTKSWATDQYRFKEVLITSGTGVGQRRIIKKGNTATYLPFAWDVVTAPSAGSKYVIVPYINVKSVSPINLTPSSTCYSVVTDANNPFSLKLRKYGYQFLQVSIAILEAVKASYLLNANAFVVANEATAGAYTGIAINGSAKTITITEAVTMQKLYDYSQWWASRSANMAYEEPIITANGTAFTLAVDWDIIIDGILLDASGKQIQLTGVGEYSFPNGGSIEGVLADVIHTHVKITAPNLIDGTRVYLINDTLGLEVDNSIVSGGLGYVLIADIPTVNLVSGNVIMLFATYCNGLTAKKELYTTGILTTAGLYFIDGQTDWTEYIQIGIDGSSVTEFVAYYPNIEVDIDDVDNVTTKQRFIAWWIHNLTTADGIRFFFGGITTEDSVNYRINNGFNLYLGNLKPTPLTFSDLSRLYKANGGSIIATSSNSIQLDSGKVYSPKLDDMITLDILNATTIPVDVKKINSVDVVGSGVGIDPWGGT